MIKKIKNSLTVKICLLVGSLLILASAITYAAVVGFLPAYYSSQLEADLDTLSKEMADTISTHRSIDEAANVIQLFEAGSQVMVVILNERGEVVWPLAAEIAGDTSEAYETAADTAEDIFPETEEAAEELDSAVTYEEETFADTSVAEEASDDTVIEQETTAQEGTEEVYNSVVKEIFGISDSLAGKSSASAVKHYTLEIGGRPYTMLVSGGMQPVNQALGILKQIFPYILGIAVVMAILFALGASFYLTAPVVRLSRVSRKMASLDFADLYQGKRTDEIGILGRNLNEMSQNLSAALEELRQANAKLKSDIELERELEQKRIAFFSAVSHELKTPITILKGHLSGMLLGIGAYQDRDYYLRRSRETAEKMEDMVQELLTVSRIESRAFTVQNTDLAEQLRLQLADLTELMEKKNLVLEADLPEHLYAEVNAGMMEKVFRNLLVNAIRYTPGESGNQIRIRLDINSQNGKIFCFVENTGVHIPEEALPHLFEAFYRVEQSRSRQTGGSGLGLYIVKMVLEQHGAEYWMKNTEEGVKFFFSIPPQFG